MWRLTSIKRKKEKPMPVFLRTIRSRCQLDNTLHAFVVLASARRSCGVVHHFFFCRGGDDWNKKKRRKYTNAPFFTDIRSPRVFYFHGPHPRVPPCVLFIVRTEWSQECARISAQFVLDLSMNGWVEWDRERHSTSWMTAPQQYPPWLVHTSISFQSSGQSGSFFVCISPTVVNSSGSHLRPPHFSQISQGPYLTNWPLIATSWLVTIS